MPHKGRKKMTTAPPALAPLPPLTQGAVVPSSQYPPNAIDIVCERIMCGESLIEITADNDMPSQGTIRKWLNRDPGFRERFIESQRIKALIDTDRMQYIADGKDKIKVEESILDEDGNETTITREYPEDVQRSKVRVDTIKWRASKLLPKVFGDRVTQEHELTGDLADLLKGANNAGHKLPG